MRAAGFLILVVALGLTAPLPASAQSLAEVAAKEKERREKLAKERAEAGDEKTSFSEEDLDKARSSGARIGAESVGSSGSQAPEDATGSEQAEGEAPDEKSDDEIRAEQQAAWREQLETEEANLARVDEEIQTVQNALNDNTQSMFGSARKARLDRLEQAKAMREEVQGRIAALEQEGRRKRFRR